MRLAKVPTNLILTRLSIANVKTEWDLELSMFIFVAPICLARFPTLTTSMASEALVHGNSVSPSTYTPFFKSSLTCKLLVEGFN